MIRHLDLGITDFARNRKLVALIHAGQISLGGHRPGKIYGRLDCRAGKRMKVENRVFFRDETEAKQQDYRPCALCLPKQYRAWKGAYAT